MVHCHIKNLVKIEDAETLTKLLAPFLAEYSDLVVEHHEGTGITRITLMHAGKRIFINGNFRVSTDITTKET